MKRTYGALAVAAIAMMATPAFAQIKIGVVGPNKGQ
jgi:branched-chain amino acid transport system substrate-binding protein